MGMIWKTWCLAVALALLGATGAPAQTWTEYRPQNGRFFISMPGTAKTEVQTAPLPNNRSTQTYQGSVETPSALYMATFMDYPADLISAAPPDKLLDGGRDGLLRGGHTLRSEKRLTIAQSPGREYVIARTDNIVIVTRAFLVATRVYLIQVYGRPGVEQHPDTAKFLESFRLLTGN